MMRTVAIQGIRGSYSEAAALSFFESNAEILCCLDFEQTFDAVLSDKSLYAVIPFKNKIVGKIEKPMELLKEHKFKILGELSLEIRHALIGTSEAEFDGLETIESHIEALKQCQRFLAEYKQIK